MGELSMEEAMNQFLRGSKLRSGIQSVRIEAIWENIMGKTIAKYTDKIQVMGSTLFIESAVAPLKNELLYQKDLIIQRVNEAMGENLIKEVVIR
jgi:hypothetical protein